jgi:hypothetical protein
MIVECVRGKWAGLAQLVQRLATGWMVRRSNPGEGQIFRRPALGPSHRPVQRVQGLSWGYSGRGVALTTLRYLAPRLKKELSYTSTHPVGLHGLS